MRWQTSQSSSSVAKPQEHKPMALAVRASGALGKLGPGVFKLAVCQAADNVVTHWCSRAGYGRARLARLSPRRAAAVAPRVSGRSEAASAWRGFLLAPGVAPSAQT